MANLLLFAPSTQASERSTTVTICYNYGCSVKQNIALAPKQLRQITDLFMQVPDAASERRAIAKAMGLFAKFAGEQSPTHNDKGGNTNDDGVEGRMDCIDHSHNTTAYLRVLEDQGWLTYHRVLIPVKRAPLLVDEHWSAAVEDLDTGRRYTVDSWFFDNGSPAAIFDLDQWLKGATPET